MQVSDPSHRQSGQVGDVDPDVTGHGDSQRPDRGGLVDHHQHRASGRQPGQHLADLSLGLGQHLVVESCAARIQGAGVVLFFAYVQADEHRVVAGGHLPVLLCEPSASWPQSGAGSRHPRYEETYPQPRRAGGGPVPISGHPTPPAPATTPPGSCERQGQTVIPGLATSTPNHRSYEEGNGSGRSWRLLQNAGWAAGAGVGASWVTVSSSRRLRPVSARKTSSRVGWWSSAASTRCPPAARVPSSPGSARSPWSTTTYRTAAGPAAEPRWPGRGRALLSR